MAMRPCSFETCLCRVRHRRHGITFHEFPKSEEIRAKWVAVVRIDRHEPQWSPTPASRVCSLHFSRSQFLSKRVLHSRAVPTGKYDPPKFLRPHKHAAETKEEEENLDLADDIPNTDLIPLPDDLEVGETSELKDDEGREAQPEEAKGENKAEDTKSESKGEDKVEGEATDEDKAEGKTKNEDETEGEAKAKDNTTDLFVPPLPPLPPPAEDEPTPAPI